MTRLTAQAYTVAWLCALPQSELVVATTMLDQEHEPLNPPTHDDNSYIYGSINGHNVVIACMPPGQPGKVSASKLVQPLSQSFPNLKIHLFVGIGSGVPRMPPPDNPEDDIHLGDVVIGWAEEIGVPGVVQWDLIRYLEDGNIESLGILDKPDRQLLSALGLVLANRIRKKTRFSEHLERLQKLPSRFSHPGIDYDKLFKPTYHHSGGPNCDSCDWAQLTERPSRVNQDLIFHQGTIISGDTIMKDPQRRNEISQIYHNALCFEMEAAGVMDDKRCLVIRGIADYADSHRNGLWQTYAAGTAAAFAREFLFTIQPQIIDGMKSAASLDSISIELTEADKKGCLQSFFYPEIDFRKNDVVDPIDKTCTWLIKHKTYLRWLDEHRGLLWLKGKPGAGKSTLMRYVLKQQKVQDRHIIASFFFHGRGAIIQKNRLGLFRSLLFQILQDIPDLLSSCSALFKKKCDIQGKVGERWEWQASELQDLFKMYIMDAIKTHSVSVQIFVDALDECGEEIAIDLVDFFQHLMNELPHTKASLRILFSCRHYPLIALENGLEVCVEDENQEDIEIYVHNKLERGIQDKITSVKLQKNILQRSLNVFQWVVLVVPQVILLYKKGKPVVFIQKALYKIPTKLNELYQELLQGIDDDEKSQSLQLMQWICFALRPLSLEELRFAMAVDAHTPHDSLCECQAEEDYVDTDEQMEKKINDLSKGLAEVKEHDKKQVAQFVHQSVGDYLVQGGLYILTNQTVPDVVGSAHFRLSRSCIRYMRMKEIVTSSLIQQTIQSKCHSFRLWSNNWSLIGPKFPFLHYAVTSWVAHAKEVEKRQISQRDLLEFFYQPSDGNLQLWIQMYRLSQRRDMSVVTGQTLLHVASKHGLCDVVSAVLEADDSKTNFEDGDGSTPLSLAAEYGNEVVVKLLLARKDVAPNLADFSSCTPLHEAASNGHVEIVKLLLAREDVAPNLADTSKRTPLHKAASGGRVEIVKLLLTRKDVAPNLADFSSCTPLHEAASGGHIEIVKLLLARKDVAPNQADQSGGTPLHEAACGGQIEIVELLLGQKDVDPSLIDYSKRTPLHKAASGGHVEVVKLLLTRKDVEPNLTDNRESNTPLHIAASGGQIEIVELLLGRKDVDPNLTDYFNCTPLQRAASWGHVEIVKLLLARKDVEPNLTGHHGHTPLHMAASYWHVEIVKLLLERKDVDPNLANGRTLTPLQIAASWGQIEIVKLLLGRKDIDPNSVDYLACTSLHKAASYGHVEIVKLLLARKDVAPNQADHSGGTPLHEAASGGQIGIVELLLGRKDADPNSVTCYGSTPLQNATICRQIEVTKLLLAHKDVDPNLLNSQGETPLYIAARLGGVEIARLLLAQKGIKIPSETQLQNDPNPIPAERQEGYKEVMRLLESARLKQRQ